MHTRTGIVDDARKHLRLSSNRPYGCWDMPACTGSTASELLGARNFCVTNIPNSETNRPARMSQLYHGS